MAIYTKVVNKDGVFNDPSSAGSPTIIDPGAVTITVGENATFAGSAGVGVDNYAVLESNTLVGAVNLTTAREGYLGVDITALAGGVGAVTATAAASSDISAYVTAAAGGIGATTATANGYDSSVDVYLEATVAAGAVGAIGAISAKANGLSGDVYVGATAYNASIGAITATANADASSYVSAFASAGSTTPGASQGGNIGAITIKSTGDYADTYVGVGASGIFSDGDAASKLGGGNIGAISVTAAGYSASAGVSADAYSGGSIGPITLLATGDSADVSVSAYSIAGNIGAINMNIAGDYASGYVSAYASAGITAASGVVGGNIGAVNLKVTGDEAYGSVTLGTSGQSSTGDVFRAGGNIGPISVLVTGQSASAYVSAYTYSGGNIGAITGTIAADSDNADLNIYANAYSGSIGAIALNNASYSASAYVSAYASAIVDAAGVAHGGSIGPINLSATFSSGNVSAYATTSGVFSAGSASYVPGAANGIGATTIKLTGDYTSADVYLNAYSGGNVGAITVNATADYYNSAYVSAYAEVGSIGAITANIASQSGSVTVYAYASADVTAAATPVVVGGGNIGAITLNLTGDYASGYIGAGSDGTFNAGEKFTAAGNIGPITIAVTGYGAEGDVSAYAYSGGNIGAITANVKGTYASSYVSAAAYSGSIGAITMNALSYSSYVQVSAYASGVVDSAGVAHGGSIGAINLTGTGRYAGVYADLDTSGVFSAGSAAYVAGTATGIGAINLTLKGDETGGSVYASVYSGGNIGAITVNNTGGYDTSAYVSAYAQYGSIGAITANVTGQEAGATIVAYASADMTTGATPALVGGGNIGAITLKVTGADASGYISAYTSGVYTDGGKVISAGNIGNITVTATGSNASGYVDVDTYSGGNIGNIVATAINNSAVVDVYAYAQTGSIGTLSVTSNGAYASAYVSAYASAGVGAAGAIVGGNIGATLMNVTGTFANGYMNIDAYGIYNNVYNYYQGAGNIGNITANVNGHSASAYIDANSYSGGSIGNISLNAKGEEVDGYITAYANMGGDIGTINMSLQTLATNVNNGSVEMSAYVDGTATDVSKIGATTIAVNNTGSYGNYAYADYSAYSGTIGNITATVTGGEGGGVYVSGDAFSNGVGGGGTIGTITINNSSEGGYDYVDLNADTSIGAITVNETGVGNSQAEIYITGAADVGAVTLSFNAAQSGYAGYLQFDNMSTTDTDVGLVTIKGGSSTSEFDFGVDGSWTNQAHSIAGVDMHLFNGFSYVDLGNVVLGTTIKAGVGGSDIQGTQGADKIFGGAGLDTFHFYSGDSEVGTIGDANKSITVANADVVTLSAGDVFNLTGALGTDAGYDTFNTIAVGGDISLTLGSATQVDQYTGLYDSATGKFISSGTLAAATASTTDVDAVMYMYSTADDTAGTQMVVVVGVAGQTDAAIDNGVITFA